MPLTQTTFQGMVGTGRWEDLEDYMPRNYRTEAFMAEPNGDFPLTAMLSLMPSEKCTQYEFKHKEKEFPMRGGDLTNVYTNVAMSSTYASGAVKGDALYVKVGAATAREFREGHVATLRTKLDHSNDVSAKVVDVFVNGDDSRIAVQLLQDDGAGNDTIADTDVIFVSGNMNPEAGQITTAISREAVWYTNRPQIFRTSLEITNTALEVDYRDRDKYMELKAETLKDHMADIETGLLFNPYGYGEGVGENDQRERLTDGIIATIKARAPQNVLNYRLSSDDLYKGQDWTAAGETFLDNVSHLAFKWGSASNKMLIGGSGVLTAINAVVKANSQMTLTPPYEGAYGVNVRDWITPHGTIHVKVHPLFNLEHYGMENAGLICNVKENFRYRFIKNRDTKFYEDPNKGKAGFQAIDGIKEEFKTECGVEIRLPKTMMYLEGIGLDNKVV